MASFLKTIPALVAFVLMATGLVAAEDPSEKSSPTVSVVPVGGTSAARWMPDGASVRLEATDPGAAPPNNLAVMTTKGMESVPMVLNRPTVALPVREGKLRVYSGKGEGAGLFGEYLIPVGCDHFDLFLSRRMNAKDWVDADSLVLPSSEASFPMNSVRLVNLSAEEVAVMLDGHKVALRHRQAHVVKIRRSGDGIMIQAACRAGSSWQSVLRTVVPFSAGQRVNLIVYPGREPGLPCKATWYLQFEVDRIGAGQESRDE